MDIRALIWQQMAAKSLTRYQVAQLVKPAGVKYRNVYNFLATGSSTGGIKLASLEAIMEAVGLAVVPVPMPNPPPPVPENYLARGTY